MGVKEYELPNGRKAVFEFDENGVGKITLEAMDMLMGLINIDLVRCGECEYADEYNHCKYSAWWNGNADFCSHGIRRKESR